MLISGLNTSNVDLLPLNGNVVGFENGFDRLGNLSANAVTCQACMSEIAFLRLRAYELTGYEGSCVLSTKLGRLEYIRLYCSHR